MPIRSASLSHRLWHFVPSLLVLAAITYMSLVKEAQLRMDDMPLADKWGHALAYFVFALCLLADARRAGMRALILYTLGTLLPATYGGLMELLQGWFFPPRTCDLLDWVADLTGTAIAVGIYTLTIRLFHRTCSTPNN